MAVLALIPSRTRIPVLVVWIVALVAAVTAAALGAVRLDLPIGEARPGLGFFLVVIRGAFVVAAFIAIHGLATRARRTGTPLRRLVPVALTAVAAVVPVLGLAWFVLEGPGELTDDRDTGIPAYMVQDALRGPAHGILVIRGSVEEGLTYAVRRGDGVTLGEDEILAATPADADFDADVQELTSRPRAATVARLADAGIQYVVLPAPADGVRRRRARRLGRPRPGQCRGPLHARLAGQPSRRRGRPRRADVVAARRRCWCCRASAVVVVLVLCAPSTASSRGRAPEDDGRGDRRSAGGGMSQNRGRRAALPPPERVARGLRARLNLTAVLAVVLPALTVGALALVRPADVDEPSHPPRETELNLAILTCPSSIGDGREVLVASATGRAGEVELSQSGAASTTTVDVPADLPATADAGPARRDRPRHGRDGARAGGLATGRRARPPSSCRPPESDQWFTALGAAARHTSVIELVNPDPGPAVADITVIGPRGPVDAPSLRGITVPGGRSIRLDLAREIPLRGELAAHVEVSRGRLGVHATDSFDELGRGDAGVDWLPAQQPGEDLLLLGLPSGTGTRSLVLANAGDDEARAVVRVVTEDSTFRPEGLEDVRVPPGSVTRVPLSAILGTAVQGRRRRRPGRGHAPAHGHAPLVRRRRRVARRTPADRRRGDPGDPARGSRDRAALLHVRGVGRGAGPAPRRRQEGAEGRPRPRPHGLGRAPRGRCPRAGDPHRDRRPRRGAWSSTAVRPSSVCDELVRTGLVPDLRPALP